jgi:hypothetical protein
LVCYDNPEVAEMMSIAKRPAKEDRGNGKEFIGGISEGQEDYAEGRYNASKNADELLACLIL